MTNPADFGTNSDPAVTSSRSMQRATLGLAAVWFLANATVNSASVGNDLARRGVAFEPAAPWIWEFSSAVGLAVWLLPVLWFDRWLRARVRSVWLRSGGFAGASVLFSVAHVATMVALRQAIYRIAGWHYDFGPWLTGLMYEYRKDALTFIAILAVAAVLRWVAARVGPPPPARAETPAPQAPASTALPPTFMIRTATQGDLLVRADEVDWIEAQGNYVALHVGADAHLLRQTLSDMEVRLRAHGFIRTHRRALVNRQRVRAITPPGRGELGVRLSSGQVAPLSESRRAELLRLVLGA